MVHYDLKIKGLLAKTLKLLRGTSEFDIISSALKIFSFKKLVLFYFNSNSATWWCIAGVLFLLWLFKKLQFQWKSGLTSSPRRTAFHWVTSPWWTSPPPPAPTGARPSPQNPSNRGTWWRKSERSSSQKPTSKPHPWRDPLVQFTAALIQAMVSRKAPAGGVTNADFYFNFIFIKYLFYHQDKDIFP